MKTFEGQHGDRWKIKMNDNQNLVDYLLSHEIKVETYWETGKARYRLILEDILFYRDQEAALEQGIKSGFIQLERNS